MTTPVPNVGAMRPGYTGPRWLGTLGRFILIGVLVKVVIDVVADCEREFIGPAGEVYGMTPREPRTGPRR